MKVKRIFYVSILICVFFLLTGLEFLNDPMELNPNEKKVYRCCAVSGVFDAFSRGERDPEFAVYGKITNIGKKYDSFDLITDDGKKKIEYRASAVSVKNEVAELSPGTYVTVCASVKKKLIGNGFTGVAEALITGETGAHAGTFALYYRENNKDRIRVMDASNTEKVTIENTGAKEKDVITFRLPSEWKKVESSLDSKGDHIYGYQYSLNRLNKETKPESLYVFYFDYNKNLTDKSRFDEKAKIEAAIVKNILGLKEVGKCPESIIKSSYGPEYHYYDDVYKSGESKYHLEFVFRGNSKKGLLVYMYIYHLPNRADEIAYLMRTTEITTES